MMECIRKHWKQTKSDGKQEFSNDSIERRHRTVFLKSEEIMLELSDPGGKANIRIMGIPEEIRGRGVQVVYLKK